MTEEIIIDGVNVTGCRFFQDGLCYAEKDNEGYTDIECNYDNYDCYFKQLERIKPENKALYVLKNSLCKMIDEDSEKIKRLEQENKELREVKEQLKKWNDENLKRQDDMQLWIDLAEEQRKKYRSALEEIREIADKCKECLNEDNDCGCDYLRIKRRIKEVLGNENN